MTSPAQLPSVVQALNSYEEKAAAHIAQVESLRAAIVDGKKTFTAKEKSMIVNALKYDEKGRLTTNYKKIMKACERKVTAFKEKIFI